MPVLPAYPQQQCRCAARERSVEPTEQNQEQVVLPQKRVRTTLRTVALAIFAGLAGPLPVATAADVAQLPPGRSDAAPIESPESEPRGFPAIADRYGPAVVNIMARSGPKLPPVEALDP